ncbi:MAG: lytic transglycosylase domain-containing protein [Eubacterium sp.]|nr:lytic transglycosylase domain-containing protein [Eubacterium sp.]
MNTVNNISPIDGNAYLVSTGNSINNASGTDFDKIYNDIAVDDSLENIFAGAAKEFGINENFLKAVAKAESGFDPDAVSGCGAQGIMQLMPFTSESYGVTDPFDAKQNIYAGAQLLSELLDNYNGNATLALAAYNAGSGSVQKYGGVPPYDETVNYINKINDILGGSLAGDSKTVDGASTTDFSVAQNVIAPDIEIKKSTSGTSAEAGKLIGTISANNDDKLSVGLYNVVTDNDSDVIKNMDVGRKLPDNDMAENSTGYIYSGKELSYDAMTANVNFLNNASYDSVYKNDPQSIYQAQASVISPLVLKLLNL